MKASANGVQPSPVSGQPPPHLDPLPPQQMWEALQVVLVQDYGLAPSVPRLRDSADHPDAQHLDSLDPGDAMARELSAVTDNILATVGGLRSRLMSMIQEEFHVLYREVLTLSREMDLPISSAADLVAEGIGSGAGSSEDGRLPGDGRPRRGSSTPGPATDPEASSQVRFASSPPEPAVQPAPSADEPSAAGNTSRADVAQTTDAPARRPDPRRDVLGTSMSPGAAQKSSSRARSASA